MIGFIPMAGNDIGANWFIRSLCDDAAERLTGREVEIRWQSPYSDRLGRHVNGAAYRLGNKGVIELEPDRPLEAVYKTFLHECAHLARDWHMFADLARPGPAPAEKATNAVNQVHAGMETRAERLAGRWDAWATGRNDSSIGARLLELSSCWPGGDG